MIELLQIYLLHKLILVRKWFLFFKSWSSPFIDLVWTMELMLHKLPPLSALVIK